MRLLLRNGTASLVHADAGGAVLAMAIAGSQPAKSVALGTLGGGVQLLDVAKRTASRCEAEAEPATGEAELSAISSARVSVIAQPNCPTRLPHPIAPPDCPTRLPHPIAPPYCPTPLP